MSFEVTINGNTHQIYIDVAEHNVHLCNEKFFTKRWKIIGEDHEFEVEADKFFGWLLPHIGRPYGYMTLVGHALKKLKLFKQNPFADGTKTVVCNEFALMFLNDLLKAKIDTENLDLVASEKAIEEIKQLIKKAKNIV
jgi:hypothetical protein